MAVTIDDAWEKLRWARHHFEPLREQVEAFEKRDPYRLKVSVDKEAGEYRFHVNDLEPVDPDWGLRLGDCVHNARTALD